MKLTGYGAHHASDDRSSISTVQKTAATVGCASATVTGGTSASGSTCVNGGSTSFYQPGHTNSIEGSTCYQPSGGTRRCLPVVVPEPW